MPGKIVLALKTEERVSDRAFDQVYPADVRFLSRHRWTPVRVAVRAAQLLADAEARTILDVGSGPASSASSGLSPPGRRSWASSAAATWSTWPAPPPPAVACAGPAVKEANIVDFDFSGFDGLYLFNPFFEQLGDRSVVPIDSQTRRSRPLYRRYVETIQHKLAAARPGTAVVTYYGFGGDLPEGYTLLHEERAASDWLLLWRKT